MQITRLLLCEDSQAVTIPTDLAFEDPDIQLEIERMGTELRIRPTRRRLTGVLEKFARFGADVMADGRDSQEQADSDLFRIQIIYRTISFSPAAT